MAYRDCTINPCDHQLRGASSSGLRRQRAQTLESNRCSGNNPSLNVNNKNVQSFWPAVDSLGSLAARVSVLMRDKDNYKETEWSGSNIRAYELGWRFKRLCVVECVFAFILS